MNEDLLNKIDLYIRNKMPEAEATIFAKEIAADPDLQEAVDMARMEMDAMELLLEEDLRAQVANWENESGSEERSNDEIKKTNSKWWLALLGLVILVGLLYMVKEISSNSPNTPPATEETPVIEPNIPNEKEETPVLEETSSEKIIAEKPKPTDKKKEINTPSSTPDHSRLIAYVETQAYQLPDQLSGRRSTDANQDKNALIKGIEALQDKQYEKAVAELESIDQESELYKAAIGVLPHAYFKTKQFDKAAQLFKQLVDASRFNTDEPEWYLLLSLMADYGKNKSEADQLLNQIISDEDHNYHDAALTLKSKI